MKEKKYNHNKEEDKREEEEEREIEEERKNNSLILYNRNSLIIHSICGFIITFCFLFCIFNSALFMMTSSSNLYLNSDKFYYFNLMFGFGSNIECSHYKEVKLCPDVNSQIFCPKFCWLWINKGPWLMIDETISNNKSHMAHETSTLWFVSPFIVMLCASLALLGTLFLLLSARLSNEERIFIGQYLFMNQRIKTRNTFISRICRFSWNDSQIFGIITFFITSITSHIFFLVLSFSDTLNPYLWQQFFLHFDSHPSTSEDHSSNTSHLVINIKLTYSGWIFCIGVMLSYYLWISMLFFWIQFPNLCLFQFPNHELSNNDHENSINNYGNNTFSNNELIGEEKSILPRKIQTTEGNYYSKKRVTDLEFHDVNDYLFLKQRRVHTV